MNILPILQLLTGYFQEEHRRLLELWSAFQRYRRNIVDLKADTQRDLQALKTELHRTTKAVLNACHKHQLARLLGDSSRTDPVRLNVI